MCGILGTTNKKAEEIERALEKLAHRGPDQSGLFSDEHIVLGHKRLSIIDLSDAGQQPLSTKAGDIVITYNGEIYNYKELRSELERGDTSFATQTDTEVIIEGYRRHGVQFFEKMRGMWAFTLYDKSKGTLILSRDHFGIKPLYYSLYQNELIFASEIKALHELGIPREPNTNEFYTYFNLGYFIAPATAFKYVFQLEGGEILSFDLATKKIERTKLSIFQNEEKHEGTIEGLKSVLLESVRAHYVADVPVGVLFSGGSDSALIAALSKEAGFSPDAYHLSIEGSTDTEYAQRISKHLGLTTEFIGMDSKELIEQYDAVWDIMDLPFADTSIIPTSLIYKKIKGKSKVVLSGEGGDEWFGGYTRHRLLARHSQIFKDNFLQNTIENFYGANAGSFTSINPALRRLRFLLLNTVQDDVIGAYLNGVRLIDYPIEISRLRDRFVSLFNTHGSNDSSTNLFFDRYVYLMNDLLVKNDMASMASSIEARVPFVDKGVYRYVRTMSPKLCLSPEHKEKYVVKRILESYLPPHMIYRDKRGFSFSFRKYDVPQFRSDLEKAIEFHRNNFELFGFRNQNLFQKQNSKIYIEKYPRFAFALVSNWRVFKD